MNIITRFIKLVSNLKEGSSNDVLGAYPESVHVPAMPERRYLKTSRIMAIASIISMCSTIILGFFLFYLAPQLTITPRIIVLNRDDNVVQQIQGFTSNMSAFVLLTEKYVAEYVKLRNTVIPNEEEIRTAGLARKVKILWTQRLNANTISDWRVRYETIDSFSDGRPPVQKSWFATISVGYSPRRIPAAERMKNPTGFTVYSYITSKAPDKPQDVERFVFEE